MSPGLKASVVLFLAVAFFFSCGEKQKTGFLGLEVPTGRGTVLPERPYIVSGVFEDSPAHAAGIRPGDVIIQINGVIVEGMRYQDIYQKFMLGDAGTKVTFLVQRNDRKMIIEVIRGKR